MTEQQIAMAVGGALLAAGLPAVLAPAVATKGLLAFPRNKTAAWILTAACMAWVVAINPLTMFESLERYTQTIYLLGPFCFVMLVLYLDELLAARALGGLLMLAADPVLDTIRWHPSPWRLVITVTIYLVVIWGMWLALSPHAFRRSLAPLVAAEGRLRAAGAGLAALGAAIIAVGVVALGPAP